MEQRKKSRAGNGKQRHGFGKTVDRSAPLLPQEKRIAEISVPAWPIPIHQTKLMIAKPHPTGI